MLSTLKKGVSRVARPRTFRAFSELQAANAPTHVDQPKTFQENVSEGNKFAYVQQGEFKRVVNLSAGCAALPVEVLERASKEFVNTNLSG